MSQGITHKLMVIDAGALPNNARLLGTITGDAPGLHGKLIMQSFENMLSHIILRFLVKWTAEQHEFEKHVSVFLTAHNTSDLQFHPITSVQGATDIHADIHAGIPDCVHNIQNVVSNQRLTRVTLQYDSRHIHAANLFPPPSSASHGEAKHNLQRLRVVFSCQGTITLIMHSEHTSANDIATMGEILHCGESGGLLLLSMPGMADCGYIDFMTTSAAMQ